MKPYSAIKRSKQILLIAAFLFSFKISVCQTVYNEPLKDIDGNSLNLSSYSGKKLMFIIVPFHADGQSIQSLIDFANGVGINVKVIGILSNQDGYSNIYKDEVKGLYSGSNILLTEPLNTKKGSGQSPVMKWLTDKMKNMHFDKDAGGIGQKYFLSDQGKLIAVLGPGVSIASDVISHLINSL